MSRGGDAPIGWTGPRRGSRKRSECHTLNRNFTKSPSADYVVRVAGRVPESGSRDAYQHVNPTSRPNGARTVTTNRTGLDATQEIDWKSETKTALFSRFLVATAWASTVKKGSMSSGGS